jgi:hypothetical protein
MRLALIGAPLRRTGAIYLVVGFVAGLATKNVFSWINNEEGENFAVMLRRQHKHDDADAPHVHDDDVIPDDDAGDAHPHGHSEKNMTTGSGSQNVLLTSADHHAHQGL